MKRKFVKMQGIGNDYIYFDCMKEELENAEKVAIKYSDRHFGIGGDGIVLICRSKVADAKMRMFNLDGSEGLMCGNAIRCVGKYLYENGYVKGEEISIETKSGIKKLRLNIVCGKVDSITVSMGKPNFIAKEIPVRSNNKEVIDTPLQIDGKTYLINCVSMGNPHCVVFCDSLDFDIKKIGKKFENNDIFPERVNTEFVKIIDKNTLSMRVWERGSGETLACGTGACAVASVAVKKGIAKLNEDITIKLLGGDLIIKVSETNVYMTGKAEVVFNGEVDIDV